MLSSVSGKLLVKCTAHFPFCVSSPLLPGCTLLSHEGGGTFNTGGKQKPPHRGFFFKISSALPTMLCQNLDSGATEYHFPVSVSYLSIWLSKQSA